MKILKDRAGVTECFSIFKTNCIIYMHNPNEILHNMYNLITFYEASTQDHPNPTSTQLSNQRNVTVNADTTNTSKCHFVYLYLNQNITP